MKLKNAVISGILGAGALLLPASTDVVQSSNTVSFSIGSYTALTPENASSICRYMSMGYSNVVEYYASFDGLCVDGLPQYTCYISQQQ